MSRWKRISDWLEKMSVACLVVGIFQNSIPGFLVGVPAFGLSVYMTKKEE
jgi:hypothetical protein